MKSPRKYTNEERLTFIKKYLASGLPKQTFAKQHGLSPCSINQWLARYDSPDAARVTQLLSDMRMPNDIDALQAEIARLRKEKEALEKELKREKVRTLAYSTLVDLAESTYHIRIRKNSDAK